MVTLNANPARTILKPPLRVWT